MTSESAAQPPSSATVNTVDPGVARRIRLVGLDVDGTLTDGGVYLGAGEDGGRIVPLELKRYDIHDGLGVTLLRAAGIKVAIVTGRESHGVAQRARELQVDALEVDGQARKLSAWQRVLDSLEIANDEAAFVGDDLPDLPILQRVALPVAVDNAAPYNKRAATLQLSRSGGRGAVREFCEALLVARGEWTEVVRRYLADRGGATTEGHA
jgi:3-deoxy-D-manno-octulosonate 8-phosphate phosphatase (KDO 8-P phosphatase)